MERILAKYVSPDTQYMLDLVCSLPPALVRARGVVAPSPSPSSSSSSSSYRAGGEDICMTSLAGLVFAGEELNRSGDDATETLLVGRRGVTWVEPFCDCLDFDGVPVTDRLFDRFDAGEDIVVLL